MCMYVRMYRHTDNKLSMWQDYTVATGVTSVYVTTVTATHHRVQCPLYLLPRALLTWAPSLLHCRESGL